MIAFYLAAVLMAEPVVLDNEYVRISRDAALCAESTLECVDRVIVALDETELTSGDVYRHLSRGEIAVFRAGDSYQVAGSGQFFEVTIKPRHPPIQSPPELIAPDKNAVRYDAEHFLVFEERLAPGDTRARHSHSQRVVMQLNRARLQQSLDGQPPFLVETIPDRVSFSPPVIHVVRNVGDIPLFGIVIEFKPVYPAGTQSR